MKLTRHWFVRYGLALVSILAAVALRMAFVPIMGLDIPYLTIYPAMTLVAVMLGIGPGIFATVVGLLLAEYYFASPGNLIELNLSFAIRAVILILTSLYVGWLSRRLRRARTQADAKVVTARKAEEALRASELQFRTLFETMVEGFSIDEIIFDAAGKPCDLRYLNVNPAFERQTGLKAADILGKTTLELFPNAERVWFERYGKVALTGEPAHFEEWFGPLGRCYEVRAYRTEPGHVAVVLNDITERKRAEEQLRKLSRAVEQSPAVVVITDVAGNIEYVNTGFTQTTGYTFDEAIGKNPRILKSGYTSPEEYKRLWETITSGSEWRGEFQNRKKTGELYWEAAVISPILNEQGKITHFLAIKEETTERKRADERLAFQASLLANITDVVYATDEQLRLTAWNHAAEKTYGWKEADVLGKNVVEVVNSKFDPEARAKVTQELLTKGSVTAEIEHQTRSGEQIFFESVTMLMRDSAGKPTGYVSVNRDITDRKRAQEALLEATAQRHASQYARNLIEVSPDPLVTISPEGKITDVNEATIKATGVPREELVGTNFSSYFTEPKKAEQGYRQVFAQGFVTDYALTIRHRDGHLIDVLYNASVYKDSHDNILGVFAAARDVTAQKQSAQYSRNLIEASLDPLVTISSDGKIMDVNEATIKVTGVPRAELIGTDFSNYFTEPQKAEQGYRQVFAQGFVTDYALTIRHRDGHLADVLYNANFYKDTHGKILGVFAAARDVTERNRAARAVEAEQKKLFDLLELLPVYVILLTEDYHIAFANKFFRERFGEDNGLCCYEYLFHRNSPCEICETYRVLKTGEPHYWEWTGPDGRNYDISDFVFHGSDGARLIMEMGIDVTERKQAESELVRHKENLEVLVKERTFELAASNRELERSNQNLQQFAYVASHDLQEPLRTMSSYSQLLEKRYKNKLDTDADDFIGYIVDAAARMQKLITDLLAYSRAGPKDAEMTEVNCNLVVRRVVESMAATIRSAGASVTYDNLPRIMGHEASVIQLFQNLIANALKFRSDEPSQVHLSAKKADGEWVFSVCDNGIGIEPQYRERIFIIFQRLHPKDKYPGTGIGLSICKKIVDNLGGRIWVESEPGKGSTFYFTIPSS